MSSKALQLLKQRLKARLDERKIQDGQPNQSNQSSGNDNVSSDIDAFRRTQESSRTNTDSIKQHTSESERSGEVNQSSADISTDYLDSSVHSNDSSIAQVDQIVYNERQQQAIDWAVEGHSFALTGPAGSGKTTTVKGLIQALIESNKVNIISAMSHKYLPSQGTPGIVISAFTNKATNQVKKNLSADLQNNCITIHKLLEYEPEYFTTDEGNTSMRFVPNRHRGNPQSGQITVLILEESSMIPVDLWNNIVASFPLATHQHLQIIFIGDIQQLPPVFGKSIYIHAMSAGIRTVELTHIYRQALESPIINLAHRVLSGKQMTPAEIPDYVVDKMAEGKGKVVIRPWKKSLTADQALIAMSRFLPELIDTGELDPEEDIILTPFNVNFGQLEFNQMIASHYAAKLGAEVWEVFTGINKKYFRVGDRVLSNKMDAKILDIKPNPAYYGKIPRKASNTMDYAGNESDPVKLGMVAMTDEEADNYMEYIGNMLDQNVDHTADASTMSRQSSHIIRVHLEDTDQIRDMRTAGEINSMMLSYARTVHVSQGSEYRKVFFITHKSQNQMLYRELIYTAITRAKEELYVICEPNMFVKGINTQRYPGNNITEKIAAFNKAETLVANSNDDYVP